jgi:hypothetical protein
MRFATAVSVCVTVMLMLPAAAFAQTSSPHGLAQSLESQPFQSGPAPDVAPDPVWGTSVESALVIGSFEFQPYSPGTTIDVVSGSADRFVTAFNANRYMVANFHLPKGALITGFDFLGCNNTAIDMSADLYRTPTGAFQNLGSITVLAGSGCGVFRTNLNHQVDATTGPYLLLWTPTVSVNNQKMTAMRVYYKLQVSPDPATATFADVPVGHPFHRFVEALHAAGITGGCGGTPPNYCPDAPVTRGQMAVFLAGALGLHWAP